MHLLNSLTGNYSLKNFSRKPLGCFSFLIQVKHTFKMMRYSVKIYIFGKLKRPTQVFSSCRMPENSTGKARRKVYGELVNLVFDWEKKAMPSKAKLLSCVRM